MRRFLPAVLTVFIAACNSSPAPEGHLATFGGASVISLATPVTKKTRSLELGWLMVGVPGQFAIADLLTYGGANLTISAPPGWTLVRQDTNPSIPNPVIPPLKQSIYWHIIQPNEPGTQTWSFSERVSAQGSIILLDNISPAAPVDASSGNPGLGNDNPMANSVTTTSDGDLVLFFYATDYGGPGLTPLMPSTPAAVHVPIPGFGRIVDRTLMENEYWVDAAYQASRGKTTNAVSVIVQPSTWIAAQVALRLASVPPKTH